MAYFKGEKQQQIEVGKQRFKEVLGKGLVEVKIELVLDLFLFLEFN